MATGVGIEPTGGIAAAQTLSKRRRYDRFSTPSYMATVAGLEPAFSGVTSRRVNLLHYTAVLMVTPVGLEPTFTA